MMTTNFGDVPVATQLPGGRAVRNRPDVPTPTFTTLCRIDCSTRKIVPRRGLGIGSTPACMVKVPTIVPGSGAGARTTAVPHAERTTAAATTAQVPAILV